MELSDYELLPGVVISVKDDAHLGRIKVAVPGGPTASNTQVAALPWCYPLTMTGTYQGFTKLVENCKVWVLRNKYDNLELWYFMMADYNPNTDEVISGYDGVDILISRSVGKNNNVYVYYTDSQGIILSIGGTKINITPKNQIILSTGSGNITVEGENVFLNTDGNSTHNAVRCDTLTVALKAIYDALNTIQSTLSADPNTESAGTTLTDTGVVDKVQNALEGEPYKSENVFVK